MGQTTIQPQPTTPEAPLKGPSIFSYFDGKKTYITAGAMIIYALTGWYLHQMDQTTAVLYIFNALGISALRSGISSLA